MRILILSMTCGEGHNAIARSLKKGLADAGYEVRIADAYGADGGGYNKAYLSTVRFFPGLFHFVWSVGRKLSPKKRYRGFAMLGVRSAVKFVAPILEEYRPDVILCTHNQVSNAVCWMKIHNLVHVPVYSVFFDYVNCPFWEGSVLCDAVFTPHPLTHESLIGRGFKPEQLVPTGFPLDPRFDVELSKGEARERLGLPEDAFVVLTLNGGAGIGNSRGFVKSLLKADGKGKKIEYLVVCGRNEKAKRKIESLCRRKGISNVHIYGFVNNVPEMMRASDLYFCRGGGGAVSEAMESGVNFVVRERVAAQERVNKEMFVSMGLCYGMKRVPDAKRIVAHCIAHPEEGEAMRARVNEFVIKNGTHNIAEYIGKEFNKLNGGGNI